MNKQLYRDTSRSTIGGVCAGLSDYFGLDLTLIRALFVVAFVIGGSGFLLYLILWIVIPDKRKVMNEAFQTDYEMKAEEPNVIRKRRKDKNNVIGGLVLVTLGMIFLADEFMPWFDFDKLWPLIIVAVGVGLLWNNFSNKNSDENTNQQ